MGRIISFMHISLDGFVAGEKGEMDWITVNNELFNYVGERIREGDAALYGRVTYEMMEGYWPDAGSRPGASAYEIEHANWYNRIQKIVLSRSMTDTGSTNLTVVRDDLRQKITAIKEKTEKEILVFGSPSATHALMRENLIDGYWLFVNPIILGKGIPLFVGLPEKVKLELIRVHRFDFGVTELNYLLATD